MNRCKRASETGTLAIRLNAASRATYGHAKFVVMQLRLPLSGVDQITELLFELFSVRIKGTSSLKPQCYEFETLHSVPIYSLFFMPVSGNEP